MATPRVGLTTYRERIQLGAWDRYVALLPDSYLNAVVAAGAMPMLLPPVDLDGGAAAAVSALDALIVTGGADVDPSLYGADRHEKTRGLRRDRDAWEMALIRAARAVDLPMLAICRGVQILNVTRGGTLHQHVPDVVGHGDHARDGDVYNDVHVSIDAGTRLSAILGNEAVVGCHHHQAVDAPGEGLVVTARADDGLIEAVEDPSARFVVGVQWHPEQRDDLRLFAALLAAAGIPD